MKKYLILGIILVLLSASISLADNTSDLSSTVTLTGKVSSIEANSFTIIKNLNWLQRLTGTISNKPQKQPITINVTEATKFYLRTSRTAGFTEGSFADLKVNDQVVVTGESPNTTTSNTYNALEVKITGRFIPVPKTIPQIKQCQTDADCSWCGMSCVNKAELKDKMCPQVMPKEGTECKCVFVLPPAGITPTTVTNPSGNLVPLPTYGVCKAVSATSTPSTTLVPSNREQILQEMTRIKNQIKTLEQRLKELEKLLKTKPTTSITE